MINKQLPEKNLEKYSLTQIELLKNFDLKKDNTDLENFANQFKKKFDKSVQFNFKLLWDFFWKDNSPLVNLKSFRPKYLSQEFELLER